LEAAEGEAACWAARGAKTRQAENINNQQRETICSPFAGWCHPSGIPDFKFSRHAGISHFLSWTGAHSSEVTTYPSTECADKEHVERVAEEFVTHPSTTYPL